MKVLGIPGSGTNAEFHVLHQAWRGGAAQEL